MSLWRPPTRGQALDSHLPTADVLIATPFWPAYIGRERIESAPNLKLLLTAGVGSDHFDLAAAAERSITVAEITGSNVVSVAEHVVMQILTLVRNYMPAYQEVLGGGWDIGKVAARSHDLEDKRVGIVGFGRIGQRVAARLKPFDVQMRYFDYRRLPTTEEIVLGARFQGLRALVSQSDVVSINIPLTPATQGLFDRDLLYSMKKGAYLVNTARGRIVDTDALVEVMESGTSGRIRRGCLVSSAGSRRSSMAPDAQPCHDAPRFGHHAGSPASLCRRHPRVPDVLPRWRAHRPRLHHRRRRQGLQPQLQPRLPVSREKNEERESLAPRFPTGRQSALR